MNEPANEVFAWSSAGPSNARTLRTASPTRRAARYMDCTLSRFGFSGSAIDQLFVEDAHHRLRERQVARRKQHDHAVAALAPVVDLAELGDVVDAGIGARIGREHQTAVQSQRDAIGHRLPLIVLRSGRRPGGSLLGALLLDFDDDVKHLFHTAAAGAANGRRGAGIEAAGEADVALGGA